MWQPEGLTGGNAITLLLLSRNRRGRVRKEESQRQEEGGGRCDELVRMVESVRDIDGRGIEKDYQKLFDFRGRSDYF